jgi:hypothetical protein
MNYKKGGLGNKYNTLDTTTKLKNKATFLSEYNKSIEAQILEEEQISEEEKLELKKKEVKNILIEIENKYKITIISDLEDTVFLNTLDTKIDEYLKIIQKYNDFKKYLKKSRITFKNNNILDILEQKLEEYKEIIDLRKDLKIIGKTDYEIIRMKDEDYEIHKKFFLKNIINYNKILEEDLNDIKHILYTVPNEDEDSITTNIDFDEKDILINKIKKILCSKKYDELKELTKTDAETEKILRIVIVLLYENHTDYHNIMMNISELFSISDNIKKFYEFTTGEEL